MSRRQIEYEFAGEVKALVEAFAEILDGEWSFALFHSPHDIPEEFAQCDYDDSQWRKIDVPSHWTLRDTFDRPIYTNSLMPFANCPPNVPEENPAGVYRRHFELPMGMPSRVVLQVGGADSYLEVWCNGRFVGMGKDTRLESEFDLTQHVHTGRNLLVCKVIRWSDSSYVEDQDQWWQAGIYRSVKLYFTDTVWFDDIFANGGWNCANDTASLDLTAHLAFQLSHWAPLEGPAHDYVVECAIYTHDGAQELLKRALPVSRSYRLSGYKAHLHEEALTGFLPWSAEAPNLYNLVITLRDAVDYSVLDRRARRIGFRDIRVVSHALLINGTRVMIRGVNRHEHNMLNGKTLSLEDMLTDIRLLKQFNFNAVRTSHYPNDARWYDLCDEYGIYVVDEANFESL